MKTRLKCVGDRRLCRGASALSYALVLGLVGLFATASVTEVGEQATGLFETLAADIAGGAGCAADSALPYSHRALVHRDSTTIADGTAQSGPDGPANASLWQAQVMISCDDGQTSVRAAAPVALACAPGYFLQNDGCTAEPNRAPVFTSPALVTLDEGQTNVLSITVEDPFDAPTLSLSGGADLALFTFDAPTATLRFLTAPDFEAPADSNGDNHYLVEMTADDGVNDPVVQALTVTVSDVDEAAPTLAALSNQSLTAGAPALSLPLVFAAGGVPLIANPLSVISDAPTVVAASLSPDDRLVLTPAARTVSGNML